MSIDPPPAIPDPPAHSAATGQRPANEAERRALIAGADTNAEFLGKNLPRDLSGLVQEGTELSMSHAAVALLNAHVEMIRSERDKAEVQRDAERKRGDDALERASRAELDAAVSKSSLAAETRSGELITVTLGVGLAILGLVPLVYEKAGLGLAVCFGLIGGLLVVVGHRSKSRATRK